MLSKSKRSDHVTRVFRCPKLSPTILLVTTQGGKAFSSTSPGSAFGGYDVPTVRQRQQLQLSARSALKHHSGGERANVADADHGT